MNCCVCGLLILVFGMWKWLITRVTFRQAHEHDNGEEREPLKSVGDVEQYHREAVIGLPVVEQTVHGFQTGPRFPGALPAQTFELQQLTPHAKTIPDPKRGVILLCALEDFKVNGSQSTVVPTGIRLLLNNGSAFLVDLPETGLTVADKHVRDRVAIDVTVQRAPGSARVHVFRGDTIVGLRVEPSRVFSVRLARR